VTEPIYPSSGDGDASQPRRPGEPESTLPLPAQNPPPQSPLHYPPAVPQYQPVQQQGVPAQNLPIQELPVSPVLVSIGDISVEQYRIVTPAGVIPAKGASWNAMDMSRTEERIPPYAIVLAILFFLACLLGLLFLLIKEQRTTGSVHITVQNGGKMHNASIQVRSQQQVQEILARVNYARGVCI
jgi:hypothetical protein